MAVYKVPQDVEAEDKLLGPFSFKQFIFLIIAAISGGAAYFLFQILPILAIIPLPVAIFFTVIALPLRKDQPTEVYLAAIISFILKPKKRVWEAGNIGSSLEITVPVSEDDYSQVNYSQKEIHQRMSYLANIVDSKGWAIRGVDEPTNSINKELLDEAEETNDILDDSNETLKNIDSLLEKSEPTTLQQPLPVQNPNNMQVTENQYSQYPPVSSQPNIQANYTTTPAPVTPLTPIAMPTQPPIQNIAQQPIQNTIQPPIQTQPTEINNTIPTSPAIIDNTASRENFSIANIGQRVDTQQTNNNEEVTISLR